MRPDPTKPVPEEIASAVNLMAHPTASMMAWSAVSLGLASQMYGVWLGAMTGAAEAAHRIAASLEYGATGDEPAAQAEKPAPKRETASVTVLADARKAAKKAVKPSEVQKVAARAAAKPVAETAAPEPKPIVTKPQANTKPANTKPAAIEKPAAVDDLKLISGVGPKLEKVLNGLGVWTFGQIAGWTPAEIGWVDAYLSFGGRIERDEWVRQAKALAGGK